MDSGSRISYPLVWSIVLALVVALGLGVVVVTRAQTATTPHTPSDLNLQSWEKVARDNPQNSGAQLQLGYAYYQSAHNTKDPALKRTYLTKALESYEASIKLNPNTQTTRYNRALTLEELGRTDEALQAFLSFINDNQGQTVALHDVGMIYLSRGELSKAIDYLQQAVRVNPTLSDFRVDLSTAYIKAGKMLQAREQLTYALRMEPTNTQARSMLASITATAKKAGGK